MTKSTTGGLNLLGCFITGANEEGANLLVVINLYKGLLTLANQLQEGGDVLHGILPVITEGLEVFLDTEPSNLTSVGISSTEDL